MKIYGNLLQIRILGINGNLFIITKNSVTKGQLVLALIRIIVNLFANSKIISVFTFQ